MPDPAPQPDGPQLDGRQLDGSGPPARSRRLGFPGTVTLGLAAAGLAALAGNRPWADVARDDSFAGTEAGILSSIDQAKAPLVTAVALVALAGWGVLLVTRGRVRTAVAWLGLLAALGVLAAAVGAYVAAPSAVTDAVGGLGRPVHRTAWAYLGPLAAVLAIAAAVLAVRGVRSWPEMGRRYDAPTGAAAAASGDASTGRPTASAAPVPLEDQPSLDIWKSIDEGVDPTEDPRP